METLPPIPPLRGSENIKHWMRMVRCHASIYDLTGHLDGTIKAPKKVEGEPESRSHREERQRFGRDRVLATLLITCKVYPVARELVADHPNFFEEKDPHKLWNIIVDRFPIPKKPPPTHTVPELVRMVLDLTTDTAPSRIGRPISDYMIEFNCLMNRLSEQGARIAPEFKIVTVLRASGLWDHIDIDDITWEEVESLMMEMARLEVEEVHIPMCHGLPDTEDDVNMEP